MKGFYGIILAFLFTSLIFAQAKKSPHNLQGVTCKTCHSCDVPTKQSPCLNACPRDEMITVDQPPEKGPAVVKLDILSKKYLPVVFSHRVHSQMSQMYGGCGQCHHHNTVGPILSCSKCHSVDRIREDISKPDLEAAYHRQCISCHREWSHSNDCTSCHALKSKEAKNGSDKLVESLSKKDHPKIEEPKRIVYETNYKIGKIVTFFHNEHTNLFKIECKSCHQNESCTTCHDKTKVGTAVNTQFQNPIKVSKSKAEHHKPCFSCHQDDKCSYCHKQNESGPFDHFAKTGWKLNKFHDNLACQKCHGNTNQFKKINNACISCHNNFKQGKFDHQIVGLKLDENHIDFECTECHQNSDFSKTPSCTNCHDDKSFPKERPGKAVMLKKK